MELQYYQIPQQRPQDDDDDDDDDGDYIPRSDANLQWGSVHNHMDGWMLAYDPLTWMFVYWELETEMLPHMFKVILIHKSKWILAISINVGSESVLFQTQGHFHKVSYVMIIIIHEMGREFISFIFLY